MLAEGPVLVTGSAGLIGRALLAKLALAGVKAIPFDIRAGAAGCGDLRDRAALERAIAGAAGIVHLGGVSRVIWGERDPQTCWALNVDATREIAALTLASRRRPWLVYASSREVYGQQQVFPVAESAALQPLNTYARSKVAAEQLMADARAAGLATAVVRFSSVYGDSDDHADRVVPAFAAAAIRGGTMRIDGPDCAFDFTHVDDVVAGVLALCGALAAGERDLPSLHFVSGTRTTLRELAQAAADLACRPTQISVAPPRSFDVHAFCGDPARAAAVLGWRASTPLRTGLSRLIADFSARACAPVCAAERMPQR